MVLRCDAWGDFEAGLGSECPLCPPEIQASSSPADSLPLTPWVLWSPGLSLYLAGGPFCPPPQDLESLARRGGFCLLIVSSPEQLACCGVHRRCTRYCYAHPDFCQENSSENSSLILADEELEIKTQRAILEERGRKPQQTPVSTPANPGMSQTPPVPGHRSQPPTHRPRALGPRVQPQQKRLPPTPGTQVQQQKGPPLPKPRVQTKPPCDAEENS